MADLRPKFDMRFLTTPPELSGGTAYHFKGYHIMQVDELPPLD